MEVITTREVRKGGSLSTGRENWASRHFTKKEGKGSSRV